MKKIIKYFLLSIIIILILSSLKYIIDPTNLEKDLCMINSKQNKNLCLLELAEKFDYNYCSEIKDYWTRQYCLLKQEKCEEIEDYHSKFLCFRLSTRPHMWAFINTPENIKDRCIFPENNKNICLKVDYEKINSVYRYSNKDEKICNSLEDELLNGECNFFISISMISQLPKNYEHFMKFCDGIANPSWRSECFFLIADELAAQENFTNYYEKIEKACEKSYNSWNYGCFSHVPINMPKEKVLNFCKSLDEKNKLECINGYGFKIGTNLTNENIQPTISICNKLTPAYNEECINGLIWSIGTTSEKDKMKFFRNYCELLPVNYTDDCYQQYGHQLVIEDYILDMNYYCNFIPDNNKENCYYGIGLGMDMKTNSNLQKSIKFCNFAEDKYSNFCLRGIIYQLSRYIKDFSKKNSLLCNEFPDKLKEECLKKN